MRNYTVRLLNAGGSLKAEYVASYVDDDFAIDDVGRQPHRGAIEVFEGDRVVGRFAPLGGSDLISYA